MLTQREIVLRVQAATSAGESVWVCGSIPALGDWCVDNALPMTLEDPTRYVSQTLYCLISFASTIIYIST